MNPTELAYRRTAVEGTSGFGLLIALYDTLAGNLSRGAEAQRKNDIEKRCKEINHALLVIAHLDDWVDREGGGQLSDKLIRFYSGLRAKLIEAQAKQSPEMLEHQMKVVLAIRGTWQDLEARANSVLDAPASTPAPQFAAAAALQQERTAFSWSA
jgi:flagellar biosynthetic protein FliS